MYSEYSKMIDSFLKHFIEFIDIKLLFFPLRDNLINFLYASLSWLNRWHNFLY